MLTQTFLVHKEDLAGIALDALRLEHQSSPLSSPDIVRGMGHSHVPLQSRRCGEHLDAQRAVVIVKLAVALLQLNLAGLVATAGKLRPGRVVDRKSVV